jgi:TolB-like protein
MRAGRMHALIPLLAIAALLPSCGFHLSGAANPLLNDIKIIAVLPFENRTNRPEVEQRVTEQVADELTRRGRYKVITNRAAADAVLEGAVTSYHTTPVQFTSAGRATRVEAFVTLQATLRETHKDEILWSQSGLIFKEQYDVPESGEFFDQESVALDVIAKGAAGVLITSILEGF